MDNNNNNSKKSLVITLVVLALVIGVSAVIYKVLPKNTNTPGLVMVENDKAEVTKPDSGSTSEEEPGEESEGIPSEPKRKKAPGFTVEDINGNKVRLSDFRGKPVIINFWASWCGPCKSEMPDFEELYKEYGKDIHFLMVNMTDGHKETKEKALKHIESQGYTFPVYFDTQRSAAYSYGVSTIPATYFVDSEGYPVVYRVGILNKATLMQGIGMFPEYAE